MTYASSESDKILPVQTRPVEVRLSRSRMSSAHSTAITASAARWSAPKSTNIDQRRLSGQVRRPGFLDKILRGSLCDYQIDSCLPAKVFQGRNCAVETARQAV